MSTLKKAVFLDRDGVINSVVDRGENFFVKGKRVRWTAPWTYDEFRLRDGVVAALERLGAMGFLRILVTNQPDIAYGTMREAEHMRIMAAIRTLPIDDAYVCLHGRDDGCDCKKPKTGLFRDAAKTHGIDFNASYVIGDTRSDILPGKELGCGTILIRSVQPVAEQPDHCADHLLGAVEYIAQRAGA